VRVEPKIKFESARRRKEYVSSWGKNGKEERRINDAERKQTPCRVTPADRKTPRVRNVASSHSGIVRRERQEKKDKKNAG